MSWSKCKIEIGKTGDNDAMASSLTDIGTINDKSTTLATEDGETLTATATGGVVVAEEESEPTMTITTRVKEPSFALETLLTGNAVSSDELVVKTNVVSDDFSVKLTPKNIGAIGIKARRTHVTWRPGSSEEEGHYVDITFKILACADGELIKKFRVSAEDWVSVAAPTMTPATWASGNSLSVSLACATNGATIYYTTDGSTPTSASTAYSSAISLSATTTVKAIAIKNGVSSEVTSVTFTKP